MSTRCTVHFHYGGHEQPEAIVYRHGDGYPESMMPDLERFFADVQEETRDYRFHDPSYLAAKYVVWQARECGTGLDFSYVGVLLEDPGDIQFRYHVSCQSKGMPLVTWEEVRWGS